MNNINWTKLKSDTDIRGTALAEENTTVELTAEVVETIGRSFITWLANRTDKPKKELLISVGMDSRVTGPKLKKHLINGMTDLGATVYDSGLASTPAMFMSTVLPDHQYEGAIMITASHLPADKNGFKFFTAQGGLEGEDITNLLAIAEQNNFSSTKPRGKVKQINLIADYSQYIVNKIRQGVSQQVDQSQPLAGFNIIVDAGNGAGGFFVDKILKPLGANTQGSQFLEPDGHFPNHIPNPETETAMQAIQQAVIKNKADLGIIFDTDVDRAAVVTSNGETINKNKLFALAAAIVLEEHPQSTIVTDSVTSQGLTTFIEQELGGIHHRFKRGYKHVINEAIRLNQQGQETQLAIETSGHAAFKENYFLDDGAYLIAKILIKMANLNAETGRNISDLISNLQEVELRKEYRMMIERDEFHDYGQQLFQKLESYVTQDAHWKLAPKNQEGVRVDCGQNNWFLLRMSLHDPVFVLNIEANTQVELNTIKSKLHNFLAQFGHVDLTPLA